MVDFFARHQCFTIALYLSCLLDRSIHDSTHQSSRDLQAEPDRPVQRVMLSPEGRSNHTPAVPTYTQKRRHEGFHILQDQHRQPGKIIYIMRYVRH